MTNIEKTISIISAIDKTISENKEYLSSLDQAIGDGDHGFNLARGFEAVTAKLKASQPSSIGDVLKTTAMALISTVGGASGPLYGTLFLKMATALADKTETSLDSFVSAFKAGIDGVKERGKAVLGEKTMLDVLIPVGELLEKESMQGTPGKEALAKAAALAEKCRDETKDLLATKGRASYLGARSRGHIDPGAASAYLMIKVIAQSLNA
ncbi:MAG: dihydroxyacetone kinase subunit L [Spirochaetaceae bacterium]|jgi:dihydroxyacetone kinase-like protein|nr:dihydroxyacetone kinase subunit L [Spirochaetaceae bacterium]